MCPPREDPDDRASHHLLPHHVNIDLNRHLCWKFPKQYSCTYSQPSPVNNRSGYVDSTTTFVEVILILESNEGPKTIRPGI
jgi:hypothetical protein